MKWASLNCKKIISMSFFVFAQRSKHTFLFISFNECLCYLKVAARSVKWIIRQGAFFVEKFAGPSVWRWIKQSIVETFLQLLKINKQTKKKNKNKKSEIKVKVKIERRWRYYACGCVGCCCIGDSQTCSKGQQEQVSHQYPKTHS